MYGLRLSADGGSLLAVVLAPGSRGEGVDEALVLDSATVRCEGSSSSSVHLVLSVHQRQLLSNSLFVQLTTRRRRQCSSSAPMC